MGSRNRPAHRTACIVAWLCAAAALAAGAERDPQGSAPARLVHAAGGAPTFYVDSVAGSDSNDGSSEATPLRTIGALMALAPPIGSVINVKCGSAFSESLLLGGTAQVTVEAYGAGTRPVFDCADRPAVASWSPTAGTVHTYQTPIAIGFPGFGYGKEEPGVWDDNASGPQTTHLRVMGSVSAVEALPGSFFYSGTGGTPAALYVHTYSGEAPTTIPAGTSPFYGTGSTPEIAVSVRDQAVTLGDNAVVSGIQTQRSLQDDGGLVTGRNSQWDDCALNDGGKHNCLMGSGVATDCRADGQGLCADYGGGYSAFAFYFKGTGSDDFKLVRCTSQYGLCADGVSYGYTPVGGETLLTCHADQGSFGRGELDQCVVTNYYGSWGNYPSVSIHQEGCVFTDIPSNVAFAGSDSAFTVTSYANQYLDTARNGPGYIGAYDLVGPNTTVVSVDEVFTGENLTDKGMIAASGAGANLSLTFLYPRFTAANPTATSLFQPFLLADGVKGSLFLAGADLGPGGTSPPASLIALPSSGFLFTGVGNTYPSDASFYVNDHGIGLASWLSGPSSGTNAQTAAFAASSAVFQSPVGSLLVNLSARGSIDMGAKGGARTLILGVVSTGGPKPVLLRATGASLSVFGVTDALANTVNTGLTAPAGSAFDVFDAATAHDLQVLPEGPGVPGTVADELTGSTYSYAYPQMASVAAGVGAFFTQPNDYESAAFFAAEPLQHTVIVSGKGGQPKGVVIGEIYDLNPLPSSRLVNLSARGWIMSTSDSLILGFVVEGDAPISVLIRGIGPGLSPFGVSDAVAGTAITLFDSTGKPVASDSGWGNAPSLDDANSFSVAAAPADMLGTGAFALANGSLDSAMVATLPPGAYTAVITGINGSVGEVLGEIYEVLGN